MKNRLTDLNNHLFAQLERLGEEELSAEQIEQEYQRAVAIVKVADKIIDNANLCLSAAKFVAEHGDQHAKNLPMLTVSDSGPAKSAGAAYAEVDYSGKKSGKKE